MFWIFSFIYKKNSHRVRNWFPFWILFGIYFSLELRVWYKLVSLSLINNADG